MERLRGDTKNLQCHPSGLHEGDVQSRVPRAGTGTTEGSKNNSSHFHFRVLSKRQEKTSFPSFPPFPFAF